MRSSFGPPLTRRTVLALMAAGAAAPKAFAAGEIRMPHAFGEAVLPAPATRIVSLGFTTHDTLLALGIVPVAVRYWFGDQPDAVWPWAHDRLGGASPTVISGEVSPEAIAALEPDLIVGIGSGISQDEYAVLSQIAPVLMHAEGTPAYGMPWAELARMIGRATGRETEAESAIATVEVLFAQTRERHPDWRGRSAVAAYHFAGETGGFTSNDTRGGFLAELGFSPATDIERLGEETFYAAVSPEDLSPLDTDLVIWVSTEEAAPDLVALPMRRLMNAHREGREVFAAGTVAAALSFGSILSLPYALAAVEEEIALALDGDPATPVPSAVEAGLAP